jgi:uncharacterized membrane protein YheB (UPF0754 family)
MSLLNVISAPLIGGIVGYITNWIAIKMLFRPLKPVMIGRFHVPFTPGIVPKRKNELAVILGKAIVDQFFNADDLEQIFLSDSFKNAVADRVTSLINDPQTVLRGLGGEDAQKNQILLRIKEELCVRILASILESDISRIIEEEGSRIMQSRKSSSVLGKLFGSEALSVITDPLAERIEKYLLENGRSVIMPLLDAEFEKLSEEPVADIVSTFIPDINAQHKLIIDIYTSFMRTHVRPIVESIDVGGMITEKVKNMDPGNIEKLVLTVVNRELRYVVLLGALIGMLIGVINIFI